MLYLFKNIYYMYGTEGLHLIPTQASNGAAATLENKINILLHCFFSRKKIVSTDMTKGRRK